MIAVRRLFLIRHAGTPATRHAGFAADESLTSAGVSTAGALPSLVPGLEHAWTSPTTRARETAVAAGWSAHDEPRLAPLDLGMWQSNALQTVGGADPTGMVRWLTDPAARPHGGETIIELIDRVQNLLAVTHASVIRAAVVVALDAPAESFWRVDVAPASVTELHTRAAGWALVGSNRTSR